MRGTALASVLLCALLGFAGLSGAQEAPQFNTIRAALQDLGATDFITILEAATGASILDNENQAAMVFAPTNAAISDSLLQTENIDLSNLSQEEIDEFVRPIAQYHIVPTFSEFPTLPDAEPNGISPALTLSSLLPSDSTPSNRISVVFTPEEDQQSAQDGGVFFLAGAAPGAFTDISESVTAAKSRVFLVREGILVPLLRETLVDFVTLEDALENLQEESTLSNFRTLVNADPEMSAIFSNPEVAITAFAPTDTAMATLLSGLDGDVSLENLPGTALANRLLKQHILIELPVVLERVSDGLSFESLAGDSINFQTSQGGGTVTVSGDGNQEPSTISIADITAGKSMMHVVDTALLPAEDLDVAALLGESAPPAGNAPGSDVPSIPDDGSFSSALNFAQRDADLSNYVAALESTGRADVLADTSMQAFVLMPSNAAFQAFGPIPEGSLGDMLDYMMLIPGSSEPLPAARRLMQGGAAQISEERQVLSTRLDGGSVTLLPRESGMLYIGGIAPGAMLNLSASETAGQSRMLKVDSVLSMPTANNTAALTFEEALAGQENLSALNQLVQADEELRGLLANPDIVATIFAPNNNALSDINADELQGTPEARRLLLAHVILDRALLSQDLSQGTPATFASASPVPEDTLELSIGGNGTVTVIGAGDEEAATVVDADVLVGKGVVHVIDRVLAVDPDASVPDDGSSGGGGAPPPSNDDGNDGGSPPGPPGDDGGDDGNGSGNDGSGGADDGSGDDGSGDDGTGGDGSGDDGSGGDNTGDGQGSDAPPADGPPGDSSAGMPAASAVALLVSAAAAVLVL